MEEGFLLQNHRVFTCLNLDLMICFHQFAFFAPFAGRLREAAPGKLVVECTGEGVLFFEANADVTLAEFGDIQLSIPGFDELLHNILSTQTVINSPLLLIQVCKSRVFNQISVSMPWRVDLLTNF
ncbi:hypothetical protein SUGI_0532660 [Cryptomeria japonica]|nr:hypothetical protein SUGI_0532660 [Cryptomeria japonica]